ncbi:uncharacterized protein TNCV_890761 [Trichonephila clavipes]|nr:uncharacterized protein TNCV_890761 [Trichonephila clavipes]
MKTKLTEEVVAKILPVYQRIASNEILSRCTSGKSQNANESLHSVIWSHCPKESFQSKKRLEISVVTAVSEFNFVWIPVYLETYTSECFITLDANQWKRTGIPSVALCPPLSFALVSRALLDSTLASRLLSSLGGLNLLICPSFDGLGSSSGSC